MNHQAPDAKPKAPPKPPYQLSHLIALLKQQEEQRRQTAKPNLSPTNHPLACIDASRI
jgi:hypothetical protein